MKLLYEEWLLIRRTLIPNNMNYWDEEIRIEIRNAG